MSNEEYEVANAARRGCVPSVENCLSCTLPRCIAPDVSAKRGEVPTRGKKSKKGAPYYCNGSMVVTSNGIHRPLR